LGSVLARGISASVTPLQPSRIRPAARAEMIPYLTVDGLRIQYGEHTAIANLSFSAEQGEFLTLLGPSGCGKTTILRAIAGFATPAHGRVTVNGKDITRLAPHRRNIGMVFQSYALFPHLTVLENVAFGLRMRHVANPERSRRAVEALEMVALAKLAQRYPAQLSGGQQQRVALARALVIEPAILLLDEPLSNLDTNLRADLRQEIRALQRRLRITTILVTHDQQEALAVSDRIAIVDDGRIADIGTPEMLCDVPNDPVAAAFIGGRTFIAGHTRNGQFEAPGLVWNGAPESTTGIILRGARLRLNGVGGPLLTRGKIVSRIYLGDCFETDVESLSGRIRVLVPSDMPPPPVGEECTVSALPGGVSFISSKSTRA
jgi:putative spermidine/putrescine transport system ATP-binding protein